MIDTLADDEQKALFKMIDLALANKRMKDNSISVLSCQKHFTANFLSFPSRKLVIAYPDIDSAAAGFRFEIPVPTRIGITALKYFLAVAVKHRHSVRGKGFAQYGPEIIIEPVLVGRKRIGEEYCFGAAIHRYINILFRKTVFRKVCPEMIGR